MTLPGLLDRECGFGFPRELLAERAQLRDAAQHALDEEAVHHGVEADREFGVVLDELIGHRAAKPIAPALRVETQQVVVIRTNAVDPDLADHAVGQGLVHPVSCSFLSAAKAAPASSGYSAFGWPRVESFARPD